MTTKNQTEMERLYSGNPEEIRQRIIDCEVDPQLRRYLELHNIARYSAGIMGLLSEDELNIGERRF